jgi:hypothetical protein
MALWKDLFGKKKTPPAEEYKTAEAPAPKKGPEVYFGHFNDVNKNEAQLKKWHEATDLFSQEQYASSLVAFLEYLKEPEAENVEVVSSGIKIDFKIFQGSACIKGSFDGELLSAECILAQFSTPPIPAMRQLLSSNFVLRYSKFSSDLRQKSHLLTNFITDFGKCASRPTNLMTCCKWNFTDWKNSRAGRR